MAVIGRDDRHVMATPLPMAVGVTPAVSCRRPDGRDHRENRPYARLPQGHEDFRFHDLRHTFASYLAMSGATLAELAEALGHKTLAMVLARRSPAIVSIAWRRSLE